MNCQKCNQKIPDGSKFCNNCGSQVKLTSSGISTGTILAIIFGIIGAFIFLIAIISITVSFGDSGVFGDAKEKSNTQNIQTKTPQQIAEEAALIEKTYKENCKLYTYKELARNPSMYIGEKVVFTGEVIQIQERYSNNITLRINVTKNEYDYYEDTIYVEYTYPSKTSSKVLEGDIITFYGDFKGEETYLSVLGSSVTIPKVEAKYITLIEE